MNRADILSKLKKCQILFNRAYQHNVGILTIKALQKERDDFLLELLGLTDIKIDLVDKLYLLYFNLILKAVREGNKTEEEFYQLKLTEVKLAKVNNAL